MEPPRFRPLTPGKEWGALWFLGETAAPVPSLAIGSSYQRCAVAQWHYSLVVLIEPINVSIQGAHGFDQLRPSTETSISGDFTRSIGHLIAMASSLRSPALSNRPVQWPPVQPWPEHSPVLAWLLGGPVQLASLPQRQVRNTWVPGQARQMADQSMGGRAAGTRSRGSGYPIRPRRVPSG